MNSKKTSILFIAFLLINIASWAQKTKQAQPITLGFAEELRSVILSETRILNIYLPEGYKKDDSTKYPVIYLLDGGIDEDFIHVAGLVQFSTFSWVKRLPKSIVVGIANTDREHDMTFPTSIKDEKGKHPTTGGSDKFINFLEQELQPYIRRHYNTNNSTTIIGESLAGLLVTEILLKKPAMFGTYIIISPSLWWSNGALLNGEIALSADIPASKTNVYIGVGKEGLTPTEEPRVMEVDANILADKIKATSNKNINLIFDYLPEENHATVAHQALLNAFKKLATKDNNQ
jgi:uncharacterized protein